MLGPKSRGRTCIFEKEEDDQEGKVEERVKVMGDEDWY